MKSTLASASIALTMLLTATVAEAQLCTVGRNTQVLWKGDWYPATVTQAEPARCFITYKGYGKEYDEWVGPDRLKIKVLWKGEWYNARVIKVNADSYRVTYEGYSKDDDENVPLSRIQIR